jgi:hypothetical protein
MAQGVERFFKAAIVDKTPSISSAALVSSYHLFPMARDVVKRWVNEAQEAVNPKSSSFFSGASSGGGYLGGWGSTPQNTGYQAVMSTSYITQYHAIGLLYLIRQQDRMAVTKMIQQFGGGRGGSGVTLKNSMALCMLVRYAAKIMEDDPKCVGLSCVDPACLLSVQLATPHVRAFGGLAASQKRYGQLRSRSCDLFDARSHPAAALESDLWYGLGYALGKLRLRIMQCFRSSSRRLGLRSSSQLRVLWRRSP